MSEKYEYSEWETGFASYQATCFLIPNKESTRRETPPGMETIGHLSAASASAAAATTASVAIVAVTVAR